VTRLRKQGFDVMWKETEGAHWWRNWRTYLKEFASMLFQQAAPSSSAATAKKTAFSLDADISFVEGRGDLPSVLRELQQVKYE
jgi:hypothetical protein